MADDKVAEKAAEKAEAAAEAPKERPPFFTMTGWIVVVGVMLVEAVVFYGFATWGKKESEKGEDGEVKVGYWTLEPAFQVTLMDDQGLFHGVETKISLGIPKDDWEKDETQKELKGRNAKVRDTILTVLQDQHWPEVMQVPGREQLRKRILTRVQEVVLKHEVKEVCFESFAPR